jgi:hypothetical protein
LWVSTYSGVEAKVTTFSHAPLPHISGIDESYLAVVKARDLVDNLLISDDGNLRAHAFEENVRSYLGSDNTVNKSIADTINAGDHATRFPVLNNGITVVSPDVQMQGNTLHLKDFQIVNGCQTSNVLFENRSALDESIFVNLKVVETSNEDVFSELVRATNSQSKVDETQFLSLQPLIKKVEQYFNTYEGEEARLYFERRERQYVGKGIPATRIFNVHNATKAVAAMFCQRPDLAFKFPKKMYEGLADTIFSDENKEVVFYAACLALYRLHLLRGNSIIPQNISRFKWHVLAVLKQDLVGAGNPSLNSRKIERQANKIVSKLSQHNTSVEPFQRVSAAINSLGDISDDRLKRQTVLEEFIQNLPR